MNEKRFNLLMDTMDRRLIPPFSRLGETAWFYAMRAALQQLAPFFACASIPTLILLFTRNVLGISDSDLEAELGKLFTVLFGLAGLLFPACMALEMGGKLKDVKPVQCLIAGLTAYLLLAAGKEGLSGIVPRLNPNGILISLLTTVIAVQLLKLLSRLRFGERLSRHIPMGVASELSDILSLCIVALFFWGLSRMFPFEIYDVMLAGSQALFRLFDTWYVLLILILLLQLLWFSGMHGGSAIVWGIMSPFMLAILYQNAAQVFSGAAPAGIATQPFLFTFAMPTGVGLTLPLALIWRKAKAESLREMSKLSIKSGLFNINETVLFGTPIVRNRFFFIPFVLITPTIGLLSGYFLTKAGLISAAAVQVPWSTPLLLQPLISTGFDWRPLAAQIALMLLICLIWLPFARRWERHLEAQDSTDNKAFGS